jgi:hypothetical protein
VSLELTPDGTEAYRILRWAQEDPAVRAAEAVRQVNDLARPLLGVPAQAAALAEVQDAGTMLSRLAGAVSETAGAEDGGGGDQDAPSETVSAQMAAGGTISGQAAS